MSEPNFKAIHRIVVEIVQSGPTERTAIHRKMRHLGLVSGSEISGLAFSLRLFSGILKLARIDHHGNPTLHGQLAPEQVQL